MNKQEQIEQMTKERNEIKDIMKLLDKCVSLNPMCKSEVASVLYRNNYHKIPEDSIVVTREEYDNFKLEIQKAHNKDVSVGFNLTTFKENSIIQKVRKETAEEILTELLDFVNGWFDGVENNDFNIEFNRISKNLAKKYGVEV